MADEEKPKRKYRWLSLLFSSAPVSMGLVLGWRFYRSALSWGSGLLPPQNVSLTFSIFAATVLSYSLYRATLNHLAPKLAAAPPKLNAYTRRMIAVSLVSTTTVTSCCYIFARYSLAGNSHPLTLAGLGATALVASASIWVTTKVGKHIDESLSITSRGERLYDSIAEMLEAIERTAFDFGGGHIDGTMTHKGAVELGRERANDVLASLNQAAATLQAAELSSPKFAELQTRLHQLNARALAATLSFMSASEASGNFGGATGNDQTLAAWHLGGPDPQTATDSNTSLVEGSSTSEPGADPFAETYSQRDLVERREFREYCAENDDRLTNLESRLQQIKNRYITLQKDSASLSKGNRNRPGNVGPL